MDMLPDRLIRIVWNAMPEKDATEMTSRANSSPVLLRNITLDNRRTSMRLESSIWEALGEIANRESRTVNELCAMIDRAKNSEMSLTSAVRVFTTAYFRASATEEFQRGVRHGSGTTNKVKQVHFG